MRIDLLLILGLQHKDNLDRHKVVRVVTVRQDKLWSRVHRNLGRVLARIGINQLTSYDRQPGTDKPRRYERQCLYRQPVSS